MNRSMTIAEKSELLTKSGFPAPERVELLHSDNEPIFGGRSKIENYLRNDIGAGDLFCDTYRDRVRYLSDIKTWAVYPENGNRWIIGGQAQATELAKDLVTSIMPRMAAQIADDSRRAAFLKFSGRLQNNRALENVLKSASSKPDIAAKMNDFDPEPRYLNLANGVLDLDSLSIQPHDPSLMLSQFSDAVFDSNVRFDRWSRFIREITIDRAELSSFLQMASGYSLLGNPVEDCLFLLYGGGRNGKTTFCRALAGVFGDYGKTASAETVAVSRYRNSGAAAPDLARLRSVRFLNLPEPSKGLELDAALVKSLTGRDYIVARNLYQNIFQYIPQFTLFMSTNYLPIVRDATLFSSGRILCIPFTATFSEDRQEKNLVEQFSTPEARSAILNWLLEGIVLYRAGGLRRGIPVEVSNSTKEYQADSDTLGGFIADCLKDSPGGFILTRNLYTEYEKWASENEQMPLTMRGMSAELKRRGYAAMRKEYGVGFTNITLSGNPFSLNEA